MKFWHRLFHREREGEYVEQIKVLKADQPLALPAIKPLRAVKQERSSRIQRFERRLRA